MDGRVNRQMGEWTREQVGRMHIWHRCIIRKIFFNTFSKHKQKQLEDLKTVVTDFAESTAGWSFNQWIGLFFFAAQGDLWWLNLWSYFHCVTDNDCDCEIRCYVILHLYYMSPEPLLE